MNVIRYCWDANFLHCYCLTLLVLCYVFFVSQNAKRASAAAAPLAAWVKANVQYAKVLERIEPLEKEQASLAK